MKQHFDYPLAVYVATFANGETARLSVGARKGKVDFARARGLVARMWRERALPHHSEPCGKNAAYGFRPMNADGTPYRIEQYWSVSARGDIVAGHVEHDGRVIPDPHFAALAAIEPARKPTRARRLTLDSIAKGAADLGLSDLEALERMLAALIDEKLAA